MSFPPGTEMFQFPGFASNPMYSGQIPSLDHDHPKLETIPSECSTLECSVLDDRDRRWVSPFGNPRIKGCSPLPAAYRSVPRPSSPLSAKASARMPLTRLIALIVHARRGLQSQLKALELGTDRKDQLTSWTHSSSQPPRCGRVPFRNDDCVTSSRFENNAKETPEGALSNLRGTSSTPASRQSRSPIDCGVLIDCDVS